MGVSFQGIPRHFLSWNPTAKSGSSLSRFLRLCRRCGSPVGGGGKNGVDDQSVVNKRNPSFFLFGNGKSCLMDGLADIEEKLVPAKCPCRLALGQELIGFINLTKKKN